jgi:two-component system chemotaxis sensor kinase CheA
VNEGDEEIILAFLEESRENLDQLDRDLVALESTPSDAAILAQVFRTIHTIKGTCGFLGFRRLEALTHSGESLLDALRSGAVSLDPEITTTLLDLVDAVRRILDLIEATGTEGEDDHATVVAALDRQIAARGPLEPNGVHAMTERADAAEVTVASETTVRVDVAVLDKLMDLVGELVLIRGQFGESVETDDDGSLSLAYRQLRLVTRELQDNVMHARLQPVGTITGRFHRVVRDLAAAVGKQIAVRIDGEEIGVDKAVHEALRDPLLHLVRNAVDHGIESPDDRVAAGKAPAGLLTLRAFHDGGRVQIELADDGRGIDRARLVAKAIAIGLLTPEGAAALSPDEELDLMFQPGLSTKHEVTNISGRGVGMDVVRSALQQIGGSLDVSTAPGQGTVFRLNVPLTLAIIQVLIASVGTSRFAIPQLDVKEVVHIAAEHVASTVHDVDRALVMRLRGRLLPLVSLADQLHLEARPRRDDLLVIVVETIGRPFGLIVDAVGETTDIVVKPLTRAIRSIRLFAGVTILGDGDPAMILDVAGLASSVDIAAAHDLDTDDRRVEPEAADVMLLLASDSDGGRIAVGLAAVQRLEQLDSSSVQRSGPFEVVPYRGGILPLVRVADMLPNGTPAARASDVLPTVVYESSIGLIGLVVGRIDDVAPQPTEIPTPQPPGRRGVIASLVVDGRVTELLDVEMLVADAGLVRTP